MGDDLLREKRDEALAELELCDSIYLAMGQKCKTILEFEREQRDQAVRRAVELGVPKPLIAKKIGVSTVWLNKLLRGEAYRRKTD